MIKTLKFNDAESKLFITGCSHLNHSPKWDNPIYKIRGYDSADEMTTQIINKINETCAANDSLLILGDFCLNTTEEQFYSLIKRINCSLLFVRGNHNNPWEKLYLNHCIEKFGFEVLGYQWLDKITYLGDYLQLTWNNQIFVANHYPFYIWDKVSSGCISLVSHSHGNCDLTHPNDNRMKQIDCGWDVWRKPISFKEIMDCANKKAIFKADHH